MKDRYKDGSKPFDSSAVMSLDEFMTSTETIEGPETEENYHE